MSTWIYFLGLNIFKKSAATHKGTETASYLVSKISRSTTQTSHYKT